MPHPNWYPSANFAQLKTRAEILKKIREFFYQRNFLEVETPLLSTATIPDPYIHSLKTTFQNRTYYLQTSPEFAMKRLLAAGSGSIFQICKAFRDDEMGKLHQPEFTMLEWYHIGFDHHQLMNEMDELLSTILLCPQAIRLSYQQVFEKFLDCNPHTIATEQLIQCIKKQIDFDTELDRDGWLHLAMSHIIEPQLKGPQPYFIYDFPASQAALARIKNNIAERFEVYINGIELANGFHELSNYEEQKNRFECERKKRAELNLPDLPMDEHLLNALKHGLPDCAGVALGIDRLIMIATAAKTIDEVITFSVSS